MKLYRFQFSNPTKLAIQLALILLILPDSLTSQWHLQNPLPTGNTLYSVQFVDSQTAWVGSSGGALLKTTNAGLDWDMVTLPIRIYSQALFFKDKVHGWVGGQGTGGTPSRLLATTDGGTTWNIQLTLVGVDFRTVAFVDTKEGWTSGQGSHIYHTTDGGDIWTLQTTPFVPVVNALSFVDSLHGWGACGNQRRIRSSDGGKTWMIDTVAYYLKDIVFLDTLTGWECGGSRIGFTSDGGKTWKTQVDSPQINWNDLCILDGQHGWAVSQEGVVLGTTNGGISWIRQSNPTGKSFRAVGFGDSLAGIAVGYPGIILVTSDGGSNWRNITQSVTLENVKGICFLNSQTAWIAGERSTLLRTTDGGQSWNALMPGISTNFAAVQFVDAQKGWAVGDTIIRSTDGGDSWIAQMTPVISTWRDIDFQNYPLGWIVGGTVPLSGHLLTSTDAGDSWREATTINLPYDAMQIQFTSTLTGWILAGSPISGSAQALYRTTNGGGSWEGVLSNTSDTAFLSMHFVSDSIGWISTFESTIYHTQDGGRTWGRSTHPFALGTIFFIDSRSGWAGTFDGEIYRTTDGGNSWASQHSPLEGPVYDIKFVAENIGWAVGPGGAILHTSDGGAEFVRDDRMQNAIPSDFDLLQNFPNPFNGQTSISVVIHRPATDISIDIYDILGRRVRTIVLRRPVVGTSILQWDGRDEAGRIVSSGVYFYALHPTDRGSVRKMILMK